jgi:hypothetical protein
MFAQVLQAMADAERETNLLFESTSKTIEAIESLDTGDTPFHMAPTLHHAAINAKRGALLDQVCRYFAGVGTPSKEQYAARKSLFAHPWELSKLDQLSASEQSKRRVISVPGYVEGMVLQHVACYPSIEEWTSAVLFSHMSSQVIFKVS